MHVWAIISIYDDEIINKSCALANSASSGIFPLSRWSVFQMILISIIINMKHFQKNIESAIRTDIYVHIEL